MKNDITVAELNISPRQLKRKMSPGMDGVTNKMLEHFATSLRRDQGKYNELPTYQPDKLCLKESKVHY
jgi:hypothetical protein